MCHWCECSSYRKVNFIEKYSTIFFICYFSKYLCLNHMIICLFLSHTIELHFNLRCNVPFSVANEYHTFWHSGQCSNLLRSWQEICKENKNIISMLTLFFLNHGYHKRVLKSSHLKQETLPKWIKSDVLFFGQILESGLSQELLATFNLHAHKKQCVKRAVHHLTPLLV